MKTTNSLRSRASHFFSDRYACRERPDSLVELIAFGIILIAVTLSLGHAITDDTEMNAITMAHKVDSYANLLRQIRNDLRLQHPDWIQPNGQCPDV